MLKSKQTTYILLAVNLVLVVFITIRAGSKSAEAGARNPRPFGIDRVKPIPGPGPDTLVLNDFEKWNDRMNMYWQGGEFTTALSRKHVTHGATSLEIERRPSENIELATVHFPKNWAGYDRMQFDLYNDSDTKAAVWVRLGDRYDAKKFYIASQKYARDFLLQPGWNTVSIPLDDIVAAFGHLPHRKSLHFNFPPGGGRFYMDYMRLVRDDSTGD
jgi:hypothetical protein